MHIPSFDLKTTVSFFQVVFSLKKIKFFKFSATTELGTLPLTILENETIPKIDPLIIQDRWKIDLNNLKLKKIVGGGNYSKVMFGTLKGEPVAIKKMINTTTYPMTKYVQRELDVMQ